MPGRRARDAPGLGIRLNSTVPAARVLPGGNPMLAAMGARRYRQGDFSGCHRAIAPTVAYLAILAKTGAEQHGNYLGKSGFSKSGYVTSQILPQNGSKFVRALRSCTR